MRYFNKGFTLLEVIAATFFIIVGLIGALTVVQQITSYTSISFSRLTAAYLAQEGIEIVRNIRDGNWLEQRIATSTPWDEGLDSCSTGCEADYTILNNIEDPILSAYLGKKLKIDPVNGFYNYTTGDDTGFKRKITITPDGDDILEVSVQIFWEERGRPHNLTAQENLYNWK